MNSEQITTRLQHIVHRAVDNKLVFGVSVRLEKGDGSVGVSGAAGNLHSASPYFIASTSKLYTSALIWQLAAAKRLQVDAPITDYLGADLVRGLAVIRGVDYAGHITVRHLLAHTSGLPDYFQHKRPGGTSLLADLTAGHDQAWSLTEVIRWVQAMKPAFRPGEKGRALYSDTNYQLLGRIAEVVAGQPYAALVADRIAAPLGLQNTYVYTDSHDTRPAHLYYKNRPLPMPRALASFGPDGGLVSTTGELMTFLKAFFGGQLFPAATLAEMTRWNPIFFPLEAGVGLTRFKLPWFFSPFQALPEFIGHSGLSGTVAFYAPAKDVYFTGTVNQISDPGRAFRLMLELVNLVP